MRKLINWGATTILVGLILCLINLYAETAFQIKHAWEIILMRLINNFGLTLISVGFIGIIINLNDWKKYFQNRLVEVIREKEYLRRLEKTELIDLQILTLKAFYKSEAIDRQGSLLYFFMNKIQDFIASSYRENLIISNVVQHEEGEQIVIYEIISWHCKKVGDKILENIRWEPDPGEFKKLELIQLKIQCPEDIVKDCAKKCGYQDKCGKPIILKENDLKNDMSKDGYNFNIQEFGHVDGLFIEIKSKYYLQSNRFYSIRMAHPTKGISLIVHYPKTMKIYYDIYGCEKNELNVNDEAGLFSINTAQWILPLNGFVLQFENDLQKQKEE